MGISPAPAILQKIILEVLSPIDLPIVFGYLDDIILEGKPKHLIKQSKRLCARLKAINFKTNTKKSILKPTSKVNFLGVDYDWRNRTKALPKAHLQAIPAAIRSLGTSYDRNARGFLAFVLFVIFDDSAALRLPRFLLTLSFCYWYFKTKFCVSLLPAVSCPNVFIVDATPSQIAVCDMERSNVLVMAPRRNLPQYHSELDAAILAVMKANPGDVIYTDCLGIFRLGKRTLHRFPFRTICEAAVPMEFRYIPSAKNPRIASLESISAVQRPSNGRTPNSAYVLSTGVIINNSFGVL